jgi:CBS domain
MTKTPITVEGNTPLEVVHLMEIRRIKRLPVMSDGKVVEIVSGANLLQALASVAGKIPPAGPDDLAIRDQVMTELADNCGRGSSTSLCETAQWTCGALCSPRTSVKPRS